MRKVDSCIFMNVMQKPKTDLKTLEQPYLQILILIFLLLHVHIKDFFKVK